MQPPSEQERTVIDRQDECLRCFWLQEQNSLTSFTLLPSSRPDMSQVLGESVVLTGADAASGALLVVEDVDVPNFSARFLFFSSSIAIFSAISLDMSSAHHRCGKAYGVSCASAAFGATFASEAGLAVAWALFSGKPNLAALLARVSSLIARLVLSIA